MISAIAGSKSARSCFSLFKEAKLIGLKKSKTPEKKKVIGDRTKKSFSMGQQVRIRVKNTDLAKRNIDFMFVEQD